MEALKSVETNFCERVKWKKKWEWKKWARVCVSMWEAAWYDMSVSQSRVKMWKLVFSGKEKRI